MAEKAGMEWDAPFTHEVEMQPMTGAPSKEPDMDEAQSKSEAPKKVDAPLSKEREEELRKALDEDPMDRFVWKQGDIIFSLCASCVHKHPNAATCDAYPRGIPMDFLNGRAQHLKPVDGDSGVFYKKVGS